MVNLPTKFEVSIFSRYGDMKCVKMHKMGVIWGGQGSPKVISNVTIRQSAYDFLFVFNRNYASISYRFRDTASYLSKFANFDLPHLHLAPPMEVTPFEFRKDFWRQKSRVTGLSRGVACLFLCLVILVEHRLVMDRQTQTDTHTAIACTARAELAR